MKMKRKERIKRIIKEVGSRRILTPLESEEILRIYNIPLVKQGLARTVDEAILIAEKMGYPVVVKIASPDIIHKSDIGCVKVNITSSEDLQKAYNEIIKRAQNYMPEATILGVLVQEMIKGGRETIVGMKRDPTFGPVILFGLGGIFVEVLKDTSFCVIPITRDEALQMIKEIKGYPILGGYRGNPPADIESIIEVILNIAQLAQDVEEISEIDLNPILVQERGKGSTVVDARITLERA